jgi:hypothetical protein
MTAILTNDDLLKFQVDGSMSSLECVNAFLLNVFLQGSLVQRMENVVSYPASSRCAQASLGLVVMISFLMCQMAPQGGILIAYPAL